MPINAAAFGPRARASSSRSLLDRLSRPVAPQSGVAPSPGGNSAPAFQAQPTTPTQMAYASRAGSSPSEFATSGLKTMATTGGLRSGLALLAGAPPALALSAALSPAMLGTAAMKALVGLGGKVAHAFGTPTNYDIAATEYEPLAFDPHVFEKRADQEAQTALSAGAPTFVSPNAAMRISNLNLGTERGGWETPLSQVFNSERGFVSVPTWSQVPRGPDLQSLFDLVDLTAPGGGAGEGNAPTATPNNDPGMSQSAMGLDTAYSFDAPIGYGEPSAPGDPGGVSDPGGFASNPGAGDFGWHQGGPVGKDPRPGPEVPATLLEHEYVVRPGPAQRHRKALDAINRGVSRRGLDRLMKG